MGGGIIGGLIGFGFLGAEFQGLIIQNREAFHSVFLI
jgi:hypothetical protein